MTIFAVLLAAGTGNRFCASLENHHPHSYTSKQLVPLAHGPHKDKPIGLVSALNLREGLSAINHQLIVATRAGDDATAAMFNHAGFETFASTQAHLGMGATLASVMQICADDCTGIIIALADMPHVKPHTIATMVATLRRCVDVQRTCIVLPRHEGKRGNPVAFSVNYRVPLSNLTGDEGAKAIIQNTLQKCPTDIMWCDVKDVGIHRDIDTIDELNTH